MTRSSLFVQFSIFVFYCALPARVPAQHIRNGKPDAQADIARVREIYRRDCQVCHGASGDGKTDILRDRELNLPDWSDPNSPGGRMDQQLFGVIRFGKGKMPAESVGRADDAEVRGLVNYIRSMAKDEAASPRTTGSTAAKN